MAARGIRLELGGTYDVAALSSLPERLGGAGRALPPADPAAWTAAPLAILSEPALLRAWRARLCSAATTAGAAARALDDAIYHRLHAARP